MRINGQNVSRYFTPVSGNLSTFEVYISVKESGTLSPFLCSHRPGDRQYKIRGPFGNRLIENFSDDSQLYYHSVRAYDNSLFLTAGSGLTPCLQMLQAIFLPTYVPIAVSAPHTPLESDEMALEIGDWVVVRLTNVIVGS